MRQLLERRYPDDQGWLLFYEVANATGYKGTGYADAMAFNVWPSRGISLQGFEIKASRTDLVKELKQEHKAAAFMKYCVHWWLVVTEESIVSGLEIPANWGILMPQKQALRALRQAPKLKPEPWTPDFIAALMRRFYESTSKVDKTTRDKEIAAAARKLATEIKTNQDSLQLEQLRLEMERHKGVAERLGKTIGAFEEASGVRITDWNGGNIGAIVKMLGDPSLRNRLRSQLAVLGESCNLALESLADFGTNG